MAKKADLLAEAKELKLEVTVKNTIADIQAAIDGARARAENVESTDSTDSGLETKDSGDKPTVAKAGKRSAKSLAEAEEKAEKEERKAADTEEEVIKPKIIIKRGPRIERAGKKFQAAAKLVEKGKEYSVGEALDLAVKTSSVNFDATVELHVRLGVDPKQADQNVRENIVLPEGTGRAVRVAVFGEADDVAAAKKAGADVAGGDEFLQQLDNGVIDFDVLISSPLTMKQLGKYARILGPKGLMPNPKSGTVTKDVVKAIKEAKAGKVEVRVDEAGIVHLGVGKVSFGPERLFKNTQAVFASLKAARPSSLKDNYVKSIYITTSMGPGIKLPVSEI